MADRAHHAPHPRLPDPMAGRRQRAPEHRIAELQRQVGNRVVAEYVQALGVQRVKEGDGPTTDIGIIQQQLNHVGATPRLAITGRFDAATTTATKAFQKKLIADGIAGVAEDGIVDGITHTQLKARAPSVNVSDNDTVVNGPGNTQVPSNPAAGTHAQLQVGSKGVAVKELQERLNNSGVAGQKLAVDGAFGPKTDAGLKAFQGTIPLAASGIADPATWAKLETAGAATQGHVEFDWLEEVEGPRRLPHAQLPAARQTSGIAWLCRLQGLRSFPYRLQAGQNPANRRGAERRTGKHAFCLQRQEHLKAILPEAKHALIRAVQAVDQLTHDFRDGPHQRLVGEAGPAVIFHLHDMAAELPVEGQLRPLLVRNVLGGRDVGVGEEVLAGNAVLFEDSGIDLPCVHRARNSSCVNTWGSFGLGTGFAVSTCLS